MKENKLHSQQEQIEKLEELGSRLRQCRTAQSLPIEEVAARTRIQARLLNAIEEGRLDQLPEPVYIKGFIKQFAEAVGLNGVEFCQYISYGIKLTVAQIDLETFADGSTATDSFVWRLYFASDWCRKWLIFPG
jgi:cytoskeletal protein RodZ